METRTRPAAPVLRGTGSVLLGLPVSGLLGLNLLDALSAVIAERAQGWRADVTWSAGCRLGNYVGQLLDCLGLRKAEGRGGYRRSGGKGETSEFSGHRRGRDGYRGLPAIVLLGEFFVLSYQRDAASAGYMHRTFMAWVRAPLCLKAFRSLIASTRRICCDSELNIS